MEKITYYKSADKKYFEINGFSKKQELVVKIPACFLDFYIVDDFIFGWLDGLGISAPSCLHLLAYVGKDRIVKLPVLGESYHIAKGAFGQKNFIKSIMIPSCVQGIADEAFDCKSIVEVIDHSHLNIAKAVEQDPLACGKIVGAQACTGQNYVIHDGDSLIEVCKGVYYLRDREGKRVCVGYNGKKSSVKFSADTNAVADFAFYGEDKLKKVSLSKSLEKIGSSTFAGCKALGAVKIPDSVKELGTDAFAGTGLQAVRVGKGINVIPKNCFMNCESLETVEIPASVNVIQGGAFTYCDSLKKVMIGNPTDWKVRGNGVNVLVDLSTPEKNVSIIKQYDNIDFVRS